MATLEKIRNKSGLLIVVIGVALLAFIIGDFFTSGRTFFGNATTAAVVGNNKIDIQEFQRRYEEVNQQLQQQNQNVDPALVQNQVINEMIQEILLNEEVDKLGIYVTDQELTESMTGKNANPAMMQFAQQMGLQNPAQLYDMLFNPTNYGMTEEQVAQARAEWMKKEKEMEQQLKYMKLGSLIAGTLQANDLDKKAIYDENASTSVINLVKKDFSSLKDSDYPVSDAEMKAEFDKNKENYKIDKEFRKVHYIAVDIVPSPADQTAAQKVVENALAELKANEGIDAIRNNSDLVIAESTVRPSDVKDPQVAAFITTSEIGAVSEPKFISDVYTITKLLGKKIETDSVKVDMVGVEGPKKLQDSVLNMLNTGTTLADIKKVKGVNGTQADFWLPLMQIGSESKEIKDKILTAGSDFFILNNNDQGAIIYKVLEKKAPKQMYDIATITYKVYPSQTTIQNLHDGLQAFINANNTSKNFTEKAVASGYHAVETMISAEDPQIDRIPNTRKAIQWAFNGEAGNVSPIFDKENNNKMFTLAIDEIYEPGYTPLTNDQLRNELTTIVRNDKKAKALIEKYNGKAKDISGYASVMESKVDTAVNVTFGQMFIPMVGINESVLLGRVPVSKANTVVGPVKGNTAVYVYEVTGVKTEGRKFNPEESANQFSSFRGGNAVAQRAVEILRKNAKVENNMIKFY